MRGHILGVDPKTGDGLITGDDGNRYAFEPGDWAKVGEPAIGIYVDFNAEANRARSIFPVPISAPVISASAVVVGSDRNKYVAALLAFFIGTLGLHRFYLGRTGSGITMLILSCTVVGLIISAPWALIDMIRYLMMSDAEFSQRYARA